MNNEQYLKELREAKEKYMVTDFPTYLKVTQEIINKYEGGKQND
jgi:hypothetical protein